MTTRDPRYDILFEPVQIGPVKTKNRFYQVPHCNGMGHGKPATLAAMRGVKAEGGWGVVCTEEIEISPFSEIAPHFEGRLWDERDIPAMRLMTDACHAHDALAGAELFFNGYATPNRYSREIPMAPSHLPVKATDPIQARSMDKRDIANVRRWHRQAALRARDAGFDVIYVYAGHDLGLPMHFISRRTNRRSDEYGGSLENRVRFLRELIEDTKDAVGDRCAVAVRLAVDQLLGPLGITAESEGRDVIAMLADLPDLWDEHCRLVQRQPDRSFFTRGLSGALHRLRQVADQQTGGGRGALYLARCHGVGHPPRRDGFDWCGQAIDCRPVLAAQD